MGFCDWKNLFIFLFIFSTYLASHQPLLAVAMRPLEGEQWLKKDGRLSFQSLQRSPVPPVGSGNSCTYIPGQSSGTCTLNGMNIAGSVVREPPVSPEVVVKVGVAFDENHNQHQSS